jgi:hypothetical protein
MPVGDNERNKTEQPKTLTKLEFIGLAKEVVTCFI